MARFSQGLFRGLSSPSFASSLGALGEQIGSAQAMSRERERQSNRLNTALDATSRGIASAQLGDTTALTSQMGQLRELLKDPNMPIEEKRLYIQELRALQAMMPGAQKVQTSNSATALMRIDNELEDEAALRTKIDQGYEKQGMAPISDAAFKAMTDSLKTQQKRLLENPDIGAEYRNLKVEKSRQDAELQVLEASEWLNQNGPGIREAIKSGDQDVLDGLLENVPAQYDREVQTFVAAEISNQERLSDFRENSIAKNKAPVNVDFQEEIDRIRAAGFDVAGLLAANAAYKKFLAENWNGKEWKTGSRLDAARMEENILRTIEDRDSLAVETDFRSARARAAQDEAIIRDAELNISTFRPDRNRIKFEADRIAGEKELLKPGEDINDLSGEERAAVIAEAEDYLIQQNTEEQARRIRQIDVSRTPEGVIRPITQEQADLISAFTPEEQREIIDEYAKSDGMDSIKEIIEDLQEFGVIGEPSTQDEDDGPEDQTLAGRAARDLERLVEPASEFMDKIEGQYQGYLERMARRQSGTSE